MLEIISGRSSSKAAFGEELMVLVEWVYLSKLLLSVIQNHVTIFFGDDIGENENDFFFCELGCVIFLRFQVLYYLSITSQQST